MIMKISDAVKEKIIKICKEKDLSINAFSNLCCITQSTVDNIVNGDSKNPKLLTIVRICDGLGIKMSDFFNDEIFDEIDRED